VPSGPCLCGSCLLGGPPRPRFCVIVSPAIGRTHNEQVCVGLPTRKKFREKVKKMQGLSEFIGNSSAVGIHGACTRISSALR
jgi:hypothetical protein